ncbi:NUDIX hydrolase [Virgibacillus sp. AGTR]|uniref:NUDIX hydrolase n=1 Tax=Virgibacillus salarius TaxID=447199 RepID=A0A941DT65_9BACI|nr:MULTISPECIES: NUDIX hydrolase [Virgibacillus]MBR7794699.1 NUDIX hydrolase [Virgibacillus salarius]MCC2249553.1 NUDIX hydrolase [Virgibacillus sp. AGTR]NAZ07419.1 NUDIX domain-containing protein [Agaribacter marinus]QRZ19366.1 NUDIX hydrolase [Virgibacillus sp. AGTR]
MSYQWLDWARRLQSISQAGLTFTKDIYDRERYEELQQISKEIIESYSEIEMQQLSNLFAYEKGYQTPKLDVRGAVFKEEKILMVREKMDDKWSLPGGFCEVGLSPNENIVKEIWEESGYHVVPTKLLALLDMNKHSHPPQPYHYYKLFIRCEIVGGEESTGIETKGIDFFAEDQLPVLSVGRNTVDQVKTLFEFSRNPTKQAIVE